MGEPDKFFSLILYEGSWILRHSGVLMIVYGELAFDLHFFCISTESKGTLSLY